MLTTLFGNGSATAFAVGFPFLRKTDLDVRVAGTPVSFTLAGEYVNITPAPGNGLAVTIQRVTDIADTVNDFTDGSAFLGDDLNRGFQQTIFALQEFETRLDGTGSGLPTPAAADRFLVSNVSGWEQKTAAQVATLLGVGAGSVPAPVAGNLFLITDDNDPGYVLVPPSEARRVMGLDQWQLPNPEGRPSQFILSNPSGTNYYLAVPSEIRQLLGYGTAAFRNIGVAAGQVPEIVSGASVPALPAISGELLTNVQKPVGFVLAEIYPNGSQSALSLTSTAQAWVNAQSSTNASSFVTSPATPAWLTRSGDFLRLSPGKYYVEAEPTLFVNSDQNMAVQSSLYFEPIEDTAVGAIRRDSVPDNITNDGITRGGNFATTDNTIGASASPVATAFLEVPKTKAGGAVNGYGKLSLDVRVLSGTNPVRCGNRVYPCVRFRIFKFE
jgi:hypothetical protein